MTLQNVLSALSYNKDAKITLYDNGAALITFNIEGYQSIESDLMAREVDRIIIGTEIVIGLKEA